MGEARSRNMKVWILDDSHFPTGYTRRKELRRIIPSTKRKFLKVNEQDFVGVQFHNRQQTIRFCSFPEN